MIKKNIKSKITMAFFLACITLLILACSDGSGTSKPGVTVPGTVEPAMTDAEAVAADTADLAITYGGSDSASSVTGDLTLPASGSNGSTINWNSTDTGIIATDGTVTIPGADNGDVTVTLTATISKGSSTETKVFNLTVKWIVTGITAASGTKNTQISVSWNTSTGAASYNIYWSNSPGVTIGTGTKFTNVTSPYTHTGLTTGTDYYYIVTAVGAGGESSASKEVPMYPHLSPMKTYQTKCYSFNGTEIPCAGTGQDGEYQLGRDADFTGPTQHATYTTNYTTTDNATGLVWKTCSQGLTGADCTGGAAVVMDWATATGSGTGCDARNTVNSGAGYAGRTDWRVPTSEELETIIHGGTSPSIASFFSTFLPAFGPYSYWTSTVDVPMPSLAWSVWFSSPQIRTMDKTDQLHVRCVAGSYTPVPVYVDNGDGTVSDKSRGLTWQKCSMGQNADSTCSGTATSDIWSNSLSYCNNLTLAGKTWRLPNVNELESILDRKNMPSPTAIDDTVFPSTYDNGYYWTSSTDYATPTEALSIILGNALVLPRSKSSSNYVRCVAD